MRWRRWGVRWRAITVLVDQETVYAPRQGNDRLLLGLKGSFNEYELGLLRQRSLSRSWCARFCSRNRQSSTTIVCISPILAWEPGVTRAGRQGRTGDHLTRLDFVVRDELGYLPLTHAGGQLIFRLVSKT